MCIWGQRMSFSLRIPLTLPVLKINGKIDRTADVHCCLRTLGSATQDVIQNSELCGIVTVFLAGAKIVGKRRCCSFEKLHC